MKALGAGFVLSFAAASAAFAQVESLNRAGSGARAAGMGNAFIAISDDGTAASWNPAGLAQLRQPGVSPRLRRSQTPPIPRGFSHTRPFRGLHGSRDNDQLSQHRIRERRVAIHARWPTRHRATGWRRLYQFSDGLRGITRRVPISAEGRHEGVIRFDNVSDGSVNLWAVAGAVRLTRAGCLWG